MIRRSLTWGLLLLLAAFHPATGKPGDNDKKTVLNNIKTHNETVSTLQAKMKQRKISSFMDKEVVTKAQFYYMKPGKYALDPNNKEENEYIIDGKEIWIVNHRNRTVTTTTDAEMNFSQYLMGFGNSVDALEKHFEVTVDPKQPQKKWGSYRLQLIPLKGSPMDKKMDKIIVYVRDDLWMPYGAELYESDGDITIWELSDFKVNGKIKEDVFRREVPKGYQLKQYEKNP